MFFQFWRSSNGFRRGDLVEVRSAIEIAATLDASGRLDGMPFMPEMIAACGQQFRVQRRADKTCVEGLGLRRMRNTVFLEELRCNGAAHDGCERGCLMFWNERWLKPVAEAEAASPMVKPYGPGPAAMSAVASKLPTRAGDRYVCQSTALASATTHIPSWDVMHLVREMRHGELSLLEFARICARAVANRVRLMARLREIGSIAGSRARNPKGNLGLLPGAHVEVKSAEDIATTLDPKGRNQGLSFEPDMTACIGGRFEVDKQIRKIILEQTGRMANLTNTVTLKGVTCQGLCSKNCPRNNPIFWREIWLNVAPRIDDPLPQARREAT